MNRNTYDVVGLMSGTSLDGLDIVHCTFTLRNEKIDFTINQCETIDYPEEWLERLEAKKITQVNGLELALTDVQLGQFMGEQTRLFLERNHLKATIIGSHGHTIFHQPEKSLSLQIGSGAHIAASCGIDVASDFRRLDVALHGQGAPLVPIGEKLMFGAYDMWLNLGGICNLSWKEASGISACDITFCNMVLNRLANRMGKSYDDRGALARKGKVIPALFEQLNDMEYFAQEGSKSLGFEWVSQKIFPLIDNQAYNTADILLTCVRHIAIQIAQKVKQIVSVQKANLLITGGGAHNDFLLEEIQNELKEQVNLHKPDDQLVNYKEAIIFALLGLLRKEEKNNVLCQVTNSERDHVGGMIFLAPK